MTTDFVPVAPPRGHRDNNRVRSRAKQNRGRHSKSPANFRADARSTITKLHLAYEAKLHYEKRN